MAERCWLYTGLVAVGPLQQLLSHSQTGHGRGGLRNGAAEAAAELLCAPGLSLDQAAAPSPPALAGQAAERPPQQPGRAGPAPAHPRPGRTHPCVHFPPHMPPWGCSRPPHTPGSAFFSQVEHLKQGMDQKLQGGQEKLQQMWLEWSKKQPGGGKDLVPPEVG